MAVFEGKTLFEKRVLPLKTPFPKTLVLQAQYHSFAVIMYFCYATLMESYTHLNKRLFP